MALPTFPSDAVRRHLERGRDIEADALLFQSRDGTPLTTANVSRQLRRVLGDARIAGVTPHLFQRTVATAVNDNFVTGDDPQLWSSRRNSIRPL